MLYRKSRHKDFSIILKMKNHKNRVIYANGYHNEEVQDSIHQRRPGWKSLATFMVWHCQMRTQKHTHTAHWILNHVQPNTIAAL